MPLGLAIGRLNIRREMKLDWIADLFGPDGGALPRLGLQYQIKSAAQMVMGDRVYKKLWALLNRQEPDTDAAGSVQE
jgi:hypothetical protein